ncbi:MAG: NDP-sugar synthase [Deltaproteobacteria bacterium]|nr:NDP-sugar synthase [Deltaproteobacteria bacterium]
MKAMVFAAGEGQRLRPITEKTPKSLVPVAGRPMIEYPLLWLRHHGIREIIINLHHLGEQVESYLADGARLGLKICYSKEAELLDTGGGLLKARPFLEDAAFIVINTDVLIDVPLAEVLAFHRRNEASATLVLRPDPRADQYGSMDIADDGRICRFLDTKIPDMTSSRAAKLMFTGVQVLEPSIFDHMPSAADTDKFSTTKHVYPRMLRQGERLFGYRFDGFWQDLGTIERIKEAEQSMAKGRVSLRYI